MKALDPGFLLKDVTSFKAACLQMSQNINISRNLTFENKNTC
jgi:hypothetical protein